MDLQNLYLFHELSDDEITKSMHCSRGGIVSYKKGSYIFQQDERPTRLFIILSGTITIGQINITGRQMNAEYLHEGSSFGETDLFLEKSVYDYSSIAKTDVTLLTVSKHFFAGTCHRNCSHHRKVIYNMLHIFAEATERNNTKIQLLTSGNLRQRIAYYLQSLSHGETAVSLPMNREELAVYLNATRPSLSRELSNLQDNGIISIKNRKSVQILDPVLLQREIDGDE